MPLPSTRVERPQSAGETSSRPAQVEHATVAERSPIESAARLSAGAGAGLRPADVLGLHRVLGNRAVARLLEPQRRLGTTIQRKAVGPVGVDPHRAFDAATSRTGGEVPFRAEMERAFGASLANVQSHTDRASEMDHIGARAATRGDHIVFAEASPSREIVAHEVAHVLQQRGAAAHGSRAVSEPGEASEIEADQAARRVATGLPAEVRAAPAAAISLVRGLRSGASVVVTGDDGQQVTGIVRSYDRNKNEYLVQVKGKTQRYPEASVAPSGSAAPQQVVPQAPQPQQVVPQAPQPQQVVPQAPQPQQVVPQAPQPQQVVPQAPAVKVAPEALGNDVEPKRVGREQELTWINIVPINSGDKSANHGLVAHTETQERGLPVLKLETEGALRGSPCLELIHGPLLFDEYDSVAYKSARDKLFAALTEGISSRATWGLKPALDKYNESLSEGEQRYKLTTITALAGKVKRKKAGSAPKGASNIQTNVAIPYEKLGKDRGEGDDDFVHMFEDYDSDGPDARMYLRARQAANTIVTGILATLQDPKPSLANAASLLTQFLFQEAKFIAHEMKFATDAQRTSAKHHFHVMLKLSPEDAVVTILSDAEAATLQTWRGANANYKKILTDAVEATLRAGGSVRTYKPADSHERIVNVFRTALDARVAAGRQALSKVSEHGGKSQVVDDGGQVVAELKHTHARPTNRIPIFSKDGVYYMVTEQRSAKHMLNKVEVGHASQKELLEEQQS